MIGLQWQIVHEWFRTNTRNNTRQCISLNWIHCNKENNRPIGPIFTKCYVLIKTIEDKYAISVVAIIDISKILFSPKKFMNRFWTENFQLNQSTEVLNIGWLKFLWMVKSRCHRKRSHLCTFAIPETEFNVQSIFFSETSSCVDDE